MPSLPSAFLPVMPLSRLPRCSSAGVCYQSGFLNAENRDGFVVFRPVPTHTDGTEQFAIAIADQHSSSGGGDPPIRDRRQGGGDDGIVHCVPRGCPATCIDCHGGPCVG